MMRLSRFKIIHRFFAPRLWLMLIILSVSSTAVAAVVSVKLSKSQISLAETVTLQIAYDGQTQKTPVTGGLSKDFKVLGTSRSTKVEFVNGQVSAQTTWQVRLKPKRVGQLKIPEITIEGKKSAAMTLKVTKVAAAKKAPVAPKAAAKGKGSGKKTAASRDEVLIKTSVEPANPYIREMSIYTVRIYHATKLVEGELPDPVIENALVKRLDPDKKYSEKLGKNRYKVIERRYAIFPQTSGELIIPAPVLSAKILDRASGGLIDDDSIFSQDPFFSQTPFGSMLQPMRVIRVDGTALSLKVRAPKLDTAGDWLPAREVILSETYDPEHSSVKVGDPVIREISLRVDGLTGAQIPQVIVGDVAGTNVYEDKPKLRTRGNSTGVLGDIIQRFTYVPTEAGEIKIPEIKLHWWDVVNEKPGVAMLPARTIQILSVAGEVVKLKPPTAASEPVIEKPVEAMNQLAETASPVVEPALPVSSGGIWRWLAIVLGLLWLATLLLLWQKNYRKNNIATIEPARVPASLSAVESRRKFEQACRADNPTQARNYLLKWADAHWPDNSPKGLTQLSQRLKDARAKKAVHALDSFLFNSRGKQWKGKDLLNALKKLPVKAVKNSNPSGLPGLYQSN